MLPRSIAESVTLHSMRIALVAAAGTLALILASCGGESKTSTAGAGRGPTPARGSPLAKATPESAPTAAGGAAQSSSGVSDEVTGIVGSVIVSTNTISINNLSGAAVTKISVQPSTVIRRATGAAISLSGIRVSDRIIAKGRLNDRKDALLAAEITVQDVVPGSQPGG